MDLNCPSNINDNSNDYPSFPQSNIPLNTSEETQNNFNENILINQNQHNIGFNMNSNQNVNDYPTIDTVHHNTTDQNNNLGIDGFDGPEIVIDQKKPKNEEEKLIDNQLAFNSNNIDVEPNRYQNTYTDDNNYNYQEQPQIETQPQKLEINTLDPLIDVDEKTFELKQKNQLKIDIRTLRYTYLVALLQCLICGLIVTLVNDYGFRFVIVIYIPLCFAIIILSYVVYVKWKEIRALSKSIVFLFLFSALEIYLLKTTPFDYSPSNRDGNIESFIYLFSSAFLSFTVGLFFSIWIAIEKFHIVVIINGILSIGGFFILLIFVFNPSIITACCCLSFNIVFYSSFHYEMLRDEEGGRDEPDCVIILLRGYTTILQLLFLPFVFLYRYRVEISDCIITIFKGLFICIAVFLGCLCGCWG